MQTPLSTIMQTAALANGSAAPVKGNKENGDLSETAKQFEAAFLSEVLGHMGLDASQGVEGAAPFASFVNRAYADQLVERGGIGLSESIVRALAVREDSR